MFPLEAPTPPPCHLRKKHLHDGSWTKVSMFSQFLYFLALVQVQKLMTINLFSLGKLTAKSDSK